MQADALCQGYSRVERGQGREEHLDVWRELPANVLMPPLLLQRCRQHEGRMPVRCREADVPKNDMERLCQMLHQRIFPAKAQKSVDNYITQHITRYVMKDTPDFNSMLFLATAGSLSHAQRFGTHGW